jgi:signal transduction histidine kinase
MYHPRSRESGIKVKVAAPTRDENALMCGEETKRYIRMIRDGSGQMSERINGLLAFYRLARQALSRQSVELDQLCRDVFKDLKNEYGEHRIELRLQPLPPADGDPALLRVT